MAIQTIAELHDRGVQIKSLTEPDIDTTTPMGRALFGFVAVLARLRVDMIRENTQRGFAHARSHGRVGGRPSVMTPGRVAAAVSMRSERQSIAAIARVLGVGASSVTRALSKVDQRNEDHPRPLREGFALHRSAVKGAARRNCDALRAPLAAARVEARFQLGGGRGEHLDV